MGIAELFAALARVAHDEGLEPQERVRFERDLARVLQRAEGGQYRISAFGTNTLDVQDRAHEFLTELAFQARIGRTWSALLAPLQLTPADTVVDLCPGPVPKVELGLFYAGFAGRVVVVDADARALGALAAYLALFDPKFTVVPAVHDLLTEPLPTARVVVANHVLDDLALGWGATRAGLTLGDVYASEENLRTVWRGLLASSVELLDALGPAVGSAFASAVAPGGTLVTCQYAGYIERSLRMPEVTALMQALQARVAHEVMARGFVHDAAWAAAALKPHIHHFDASACWVLRWTGA